MNTIWSSFFSLLRSEAFFFSSLFFWRERKENDVSSNPRQLTTLWVFFLSRPFLLDPTQTDIIIIIVVIYSWYDDAFSLSEVSLRRHKNETKERGKKKKKKKKKKRGATTLIIRRRDETETAGI